MLHAAAVLLEAFVVATALARSVQEIKSFEDVVGQRVATLCFTQRLTRPTLASLKTSVKFPKSGNELCLLLFEHLNIASEVSLSNMHGKQTTYPLG